jgi:ketosteroid isomerase-like protein
VTTRIDEAAALQANAEFYAAMASGDFAAMDALWSEAEIVLCTHPGGVMVSGREAIMKTWRDLFDSGGTPIRFSHERVALIRGLAFVTCHEHLGDVVLSATNVLVWESRAWRLVLHQAGVVADPDAIGDEIDAGEVLH